MALKRIKQELSHSFLQAHSPGEPTNFFENVPFKTGHASGVKVCFTYPTDYPFKPPKVALQMPGVEEPLEIQGSKLWLEKNWDPRKGTATILGAFLDFLEMDTHPEAIRHRVVGGEFAAVWIFLGCAQDLIQSGWKGDISSSPVLFENLPAFQEGGGSTQKKVAVILIDSSLPLDARLVQADPRPILSTSTPAASAAAPAIPPVEAIKGTELPAAAAAESSGRSDRTYRQNRYTEVANDSLSLFVMSAMLLPPALPALLNLYKTAQETPGVEAGLYDMRGASYGSVDYPILEDVHPYPASGSSADTLWVSLCEWMRELCPSDAVIRIRRELKDPFLQAFLHREPQKASDYFSGVPFNTEHPGIKLFFSYSPHSDTPFDTSVDVEMQVEGEDKPRRICRTDQLRFLSTDFSSEWKPTRQNVKTAEVLGTFLDFLEMDKRLNQIRQRVTGKEFGVLKIFVGCSRALIQSGRYGDISFSPVQFDPPPPLRLTTLSTQKKVAVVLIDPALPLDCRLNGPPPEFVPTITNPTASTAPQTQRRRTSEEAAVADAATASVSVSGRQDRTHRRNRYTEVSSNSLSVFVLSSMLLPPSLPILLDLHKSAQETEGVDAQLYDLRGRDAFGRDFGNVPFPLSSDALGNEEIQNATGELRELLQSLSQWLRTSKNPDPASSYRAPGLSSTSHLAPSDSFRFGPSTELQGPPITGVAQPSRGLSDDPDLQDALAASLSTLGGDDDLRVAMEESERRMKEQEEEDLAAAISASLQQAE
uniref:Uncharacterized protein n=1 Tax=Chromera velia CCMP2878 TaxID=1169474 RepID=A0A0G4HQN1_9ALVE|eukprot:Cvel_7954.t1-p1 / transcript=Cvel_7954.t1 / gene=Cvel_7954 / organism=Chromera_velia_CCMP2878 / gene_product=hypothetical protein / transcript_product=hypothetical protein / location=Cvel_scaffold428:3633-5921(+) / protein_length=763 / sequence_SO=supercontig / SO=protein_coding / is_pseudo=false